MARYENDLVSVIHWPLKSWLLFISLVYVIGRFVLWEFYGPFFEPNEFIYSHNNMYHTIGVVVIIIMLAITGREAIQDIWNKMQFFSLITLSVILLCEIVFITGGVLDSPFSGAISLYLASFILLQRDSEYWRFNVGIAVLTLLLLAFPYIWLSINYKEMYICKYYTYSSVTWGRLCINIFLLIVTGFAADRVSNRVNRINRNRIH